MRLLCFISFSKRSKSLQNVDEWKCRNKFSYICQMLKGESRMKFLVTFDQTSADFIRCEILTLTHCLYTERLSVVQKTAHCPVDRRPVFQFCRRLTIVKSNGNDWWGLSRPTIGTLAKCISINFRFAQFAKRNFSTCLTMTRVIKTTLWEWWWAENFYKPTIHPKMFCVGSHPKLQRCAQKLPWKFKHWFVEKLFTVIMHVQHFMSNKCSWETNETRMSFIKLYVIAQCQKDWHKQFIINVEHYVCHKGNCYFPWNFILCKWTKFMLIQTCNEFFMGQINFV